ncbi:MAG: hypothetical protein SGJ01_00335 [Gemmatimonadota bacterium]|nr:hypothetical protein [Gemmatimonadota bacterium]
MPLTAGYVATVIARYLAPWEVLARAAGSATDPRAVRAQFVSGYRCAAGGGSIYVTRRDGIHVELAATQGAGRVARVGVITWPAMFPHVVDRLTPQWVAVLAAAVTADAEQRATFVACPGPHPDTATWHREDAAEYYRTDHALSTATTAAPTPSSPRTTTRSWTCWTC